MPRKPQKPLNLIFKEPPEAFVVSVDSVTSRHSLGMPLMSEAVAGVKHWSRQHVKRFSLN